MRLPLGIVVSLLLVKLIQAQLPGRSYEIEHTWNTIDFVLENHTSYVQGAYNTRNIIVEDAVKTLDGRTIVSTKVYDRLPTLSIMSNIFHKNTPVLTPFPNIHFHATINSCRPIMEVRSLLTDDYQRLWVLSKGLGACPDRLLLFNLVKNQLVANEPLINVKLNERRKEGEIYNGASIEVPRESVNNVTIYCDDYDGLLKLRIELSESSNGTINMNITYTDTNKVNIPSETFIQNGLTAMSLSPYTYPSSSTSSANPVHPERYLYFGILPENNLYRRTISLVGDGPIEYVPGYKATQQAFSRDGVVFYSLDGHEGMDCYNFQKQPHPIFHGFLFRDYKGGFYSSLRTYQLQINNTQEERLMAFYKINPTALIVMNRYSIITSRVTDIVRGTDCGAESRSN